MSIGNNYINDFEYAKTKLNDKLNKAREAFTKEKSKLNKIEYLQLIDDMRKLNLLDEETVKKYLN